MSYQNVPKYVRQHSLPAKIEDELEKAKIKAQLAEEQPYTAMAIVDNIKIPTTLLGNQRENSQTSD